MQVHHKKVKKDEVAQELTAFCLLNNEEDPNIHQTISNCARLMEGGIIVERKDTEGKKTKGILLLKVKLDRILKCYIQLICPHI